MTETTRRHPRTMQEAFGPYATSNFQDDPMPMADTIIVIASVIALVAIAVFAVIGWIPS